MPWGKLYRRDFLNEYGVRFREGLHREEDIGFNLTALAHCTHVKSCPYPLYHYRRSLDTQSHTYRPEIRRETAARIERYFAGKKYDMSWCIYSGDDWIAPDRSDERILKEERIVEARSREGTVDDLPAGAGVNKFLCICAPGTISRIEAEVREAFPETAVVRSSDILLEIMAKGISKREAVLRYCRYLGISPQETVAFGDNYNDVEMLQAAGTGYVMGNAPEEIRAGAAHVTADNDHDGIAQILEQIIPD